MGPFDVGNQELKGKDRSAFWAFTVVFGYEGEPHHDYDRNEESGLRGITQKSFAGLFHSFSVIYLEVCREAAFAGVLPGSFVSASRTNLLHADYVREIYATVAHEVAHSPNGVRHEYFDHKEGGLMNSGLGRASDEFTPKTLRRLRESMQWTR